MLNNPYDYLTAFFIMCGLYADMILLKMFIAEIKEKGGGEKYLSNRN